MFKCRSSEKELLDTLIPDERDLRKNLDEMEMINTWCGSKKSVIHFINKMSKKYVGKNNNISLVDLGCGKGDLLRAIDNWSQKKNIKLDLFGMDINPQSIQYAVENSAANPNIQYRTCDIFSDEFKQHRYDIIFINNVCHHFNDDDLTKLFQQLAKQARMAVFISDLQRNRLSYFLIKWLSKSLNLSYLAKHDGPLSVLRAFHKNELLNILSKADISNYEIHWAWAFRWEIILWCKQ